MYVSKFLGTTIPSFSKGFIFSRTTSFLVDGSDFTRSDSMLRNCNLVSVRTRNMTNNINLPTFVTKSSHFLHNSERNGKWLQMTCLLKNYLFIHLLLKYFSMTVVEKPCCGVEQIFGNSSSSTSMAVGIFSSYSISSKSNKKLTTCISLPFSLSFSFTSLLKLILYQCMYVISLIVSVMFKSTLDVSRLL